MKVILNKSCLATKMCVKFYTVHCKAVFSHSSWKFLHLARLFYTTSGCDGCDKYEVWSGHNSN